MPTRSGPGLLDLPAELRLMIFRHLLVSPDDIELVSWAPKLGFSLDLLRKSKLIHREASDVLYGENHYCDYYHTGIITAVNL